MWELLLRYCHLASFCQNVGHKVTGHLVWNVKMDCMHKARWVLDRHQDTGPRGVNLCWSRIQRKHVDSLLVCCSKSGLMSLQQTSRMRTSKLHPRVRITLFVAQNLEWRTLDRLHSFTGHCMVGRLPEGISGII